MIIRIATVCHMLVLLMLGASTVLAENWGASARAHPRPTDPVSFQSWITTLRNDRDPSSKAAVQAQFGQPTFVGDTKQLAGLVRINQGGKPVDVQVLITVKQSKGAACASYYASGWSSVARPVAFNFPCSTEPQPWGLGTPTAISNLFGTTQMFPDGSVGANGAAGQTPESAGSTHAFVASGFSSAVRPTLADADVMMSSLEALFTTTWGVLPMPLVETFAWTAWYGSQRWSPPAF